MSHGGLFARFVLQGGGDEPWGAARTLCAPWGRGGAMGEGGGGRMMVSHGRRGQVMMMSHGGGGGGAGVDYALVGGGGGGSRRRCVGVASFVQLSGS